MQKFINYLFIFLKGMCYVDPPPPQNKQTNKKKLLLLKFN